jgi:SAM-dependent methyltransferase
MPNEQSKAAQRRLLDPRFSERWFVGDGLDIGCGNDPIDIDRWPLVSSITTYDREIDPTHNAETLVGLDDGMFDFVHASHCLEHMTDPMTTLEAWLQVLKPGGFLIVTVPDWVMYESCHWPSRNNGDHKAAFTTRGDDNYFKARDAKVPIIHLPADLYTDNGGYDVKIPDFTLEHLSLITTHYNPLLFGSDQTQGPAECAIEFVLRKHLPDGQLERRIVAE